MATKPTANGSGKGGDFNTRKNPFAQVRLVSRRPSLADNTSVGLALDQILKQGCAVMLGGTRDGGALVLTILDGDDRHRTYCSNEGELDAALQTIMMLYSD